jgi:hypothetical protein
MGDWYDDNQSETAQVAGQRLNFLDEFDLRDAVPLEREVRHHSLAFFTQFYRQFGSLDFLDRRRPYEIYVVGTEIMLSAGTHRGIWRSINDLPLIVPVNIKRFTDQTSITHYLGEIEKSRSVGIHSVKDLARTVQNPEQYVMHGPIIVSMDIAEIQMGNRYQF